MTGEGGPASATVPLTAAQRARLFAGCLPALGFAALTAAGYAVAIALDWETPWVIPVLAIVLLAFMLRDAVQRLRDLSRGVALTDEDLLERTSEAGNRYTGVFARLGTLTMSQALRTDMLPRMRYRVTYSPASRILWSAEPVTRGRDTWFRQR